MRYYLPLAPSCCAGGPGRSSPRSKRRARRAALLAFPGRLGPVSCSAALAHRSTANRRPDGGWNSLPHCQRRAREDKRMITENRADPDVKPGYGNRIRDRRKKRRGRCSSAPRAAHGLELQRSIEKPSRLRLFVKWNPPSRTTVDFRGSPDFQEWRKSMWLIVLLRHPRSEHVPCAGR